MSLREFLAVLRARWKVVVAAVLLVLAATAAGLSTITPVYTASASFYLAAKDNSSSPENKGTYVVTTSDLSTYVAVLGSPAVMDPLRKRLGLPAGTPIDVSAAVASPTSILTITARSTDPDLAAEIANATGPQLADVADQFSVLLKAAGQSVVATTVSPASVPGSPTSPNLTRGMLLGLLAGLCLGVGLAFIRHTLDTKVRTDADIKALSKSPILGKLPVERAAGKGVAVEHDPHGAYAEAVRRLRTNLQFVDVTTGTHSFVVTSAMPSEGKTTVAINLARAMTQAGGRVLLVDADLRNPSVHAVMGLEGSVGLTTVLLGKAAVDEVVQQWGDSDLYVLTAGQVPPNPSELLGSEAMQSLFSKLSQEFDFILVDSPPLVPVIDAVIVDKLTGGMLMVVAADRTKKKDLTTALKSLETVGTQVSGFAWNFVATSKSEASRYGYYRYGGRRTGETAEERPQHSTRATPGVGLEQSVSDE